jgi:hypothetical protein
VCWLDVEKQIFHRLDHGYPYGQELSIDVNFLDAMIESFDYRRYAMATFVGFSEILRTGYRFTEALTVRLLRCTPFHPGHICLTDQVKAPMHVRQKTIFPFLQIRVSYHTAR